MGEHTAIGWTDHTFNPWIGCTKVGPGCDHCYAEKLATSRLGVAWGPHADRRQTRPATWTQPLRWNRAAEKAGVRARVFCASMADVFDNQVPEAWRDSLWALIRETPALDWQLLTKRPTNIHRMLPADWGPDGYPNVGLGVTITGDGEAEKNLSPFRSLRYRYLFVSYEPALRPLDLRRWLFGSHESTDLIVNWVICGGESGPDARPMHPVWARRVRDHCAGSMTPFFFKQWGEWKPASEIDAVELERLYHPRLAANPQIPRRPRVVVKRLRFDGEVREAGAHDAFVSDFMVDGYPGMTVFRTGKEASGDLLDGQQHREFPHVRDD